MNELVVYGTYIILEKANRTTCCILLRVTKAVTSYVRLKTAPPPRGGPPPGGGTPPSPPPRGGPPPLN